jgi:hypothetical protein
VGALTALTARAINGPLLAFLLVSAALVAPAPVAAADVTFDAPTATGSLGKPLVFSVTFRTAERPDRVELLTNLVGEDARLVEEAEVSESNGVHTARVTRKGHTTPNTTLEYRFRAVSAGTATLSQQARFTVKDERFQWRVVEGRLVRVHWHEGSDEFGRRALEIGEAAVARASTLLGVEETAPVDFFIYGNEAEFREALGPGTRENVGGQANAAIRTLFALIGPGSINDDWVGVVIPHELTHLVFNTAVDNPYHLPPRWLNEGLAVYLSQGYVASDKALVTAAARRGDLIPLQGLAGLFPTSRSKFYQAYAESASATDFFVRRYGEDKLVQLIRSYAAGRTDDEAFTAATGAGVEAFNAAWFADLDARVPEPLGPRPGEPGPTPAEWAAGSPPPASPAPSGAAPRATTGATGGTGVSTLSPGASGTPGRTSSIASPSVAPTSSGGATATRGATGGSSVVLVEGPASLPVLLAGAAGILVLVGAMALSRRRSKGWRE